MYTDNGEKMTEAEIQGLITWYQAFRAAAFREHNKVAAAVAAMNMDQSAVPVMIPIHPGLTKSPALDVQIDCFGLFQELVLHEFTRLTAADPENPTTAEIATAQIQLAMQYFTFQSYSDMVGNTEAAK